MSQNRVVAAFAAAGMALQTSLDFADIVATGFESILQNPMRLGGGLLVSATALGTLALASPVSAAQPAVVLAENTTPALLIARVRGSYAVPVTQGNGSFMGVLAFGGYDGATIAQAGGISASSTETWTSTAHGHKLLFNVVPNTTTTATTALTLDQDLSATFAGIAKMPVSTAARASMNIGDAGTAPTSPNNGDVWIESNALKVRLNGVTKTVTVT